MQPTTNTTQPTGKSQMSLHVQPSIEQHKNDKQHPLRLRGGGAGRDCFLGLVECFICFECCKDCCECFADIVCCPCEMCC